MSQANSSIMPRSDEPELATAGASTLVDIGEWFQEQKHREADIFKQHETEISRAIELEHVHAEIYNLAWSAAELEADSLAAMRIKAQLLEEYVDCPETDIIHSLALSLARDVQRVLNAQQNQHHRG